MEAPRDLLVCGVEAQREVGRQHHGRVPLRRVVRVGDAARAVLGPPLLCARWTRGQLPFVAEQGLEEAVVPLDRRGRPCALEAARDCVLAFAGAEGILPAQALVVNGTTFGLWAHVP